MSSASPPLFPDDLRTDARWLAQSLDPASGTMGFVAMSGADYRSSAFLDDRMFDVPHDRREMDLPGVIAAMAGRRQDARWIFHIGHVGSTLIARLLGEFPGILSVREPRLLRDLLPLPPQQRLALAPTIRALYSRTFAPDGASVVKATSFVSEIAGELMLPDARALMLYASPRHYIGGILAGENSSQELHGLAQFRANLLGRRSGPLPAPRHLADLAAIGWACGMTALEAAASTRHDASVLWCDFDRFLGDVRFGLASIATALDLQASDDDLAALASSNLLGRYSKATEYDYSAGLRADLIADASRHYAADIDEAMAMLETVARGSPLLLRALERSEDD